MKRILAGLILLIPLVTLAQTAARPTTPDSTATNPAGRIDVLGSHNLSSSASPVRGRQANACSYCHAAHHGGKTALWNQTLSTHTQNLNAASTERNNTAMATVGKSSALCLSCHDGTVAVGQTIAYGRMSMTGTMNRGVGKALQGSHPISLQLPLKDAAHLVAGFAGSANPSQLNSTAKRQSMIRPGNPVVLPDGNVECNTCHDVHNQFVDKKDLNFLVRDNTGGALCLSCHGTSPRTVGGVSNSLAQWTGSIHSNSTAQVAPSAGIGNRATVADYGCATCHVSHDSAGPGLLRKAAYVLTTNDPTSQGCLICHDGSSHLVQPIGNVLADFQKGGHPFADAQNTHAASEPVVLDHNRHTTCADCHQAHGSRATTTFAAPPDLRPSQLGVAGVGADGVPLAAATKQFENCLRCHGSSPGKQSLASMGYMPARALYAGDALNVIVQFGSFALSSHPVMRDSTMRFQGTLRVSMLDLSGKLPIREMGTRILCTDCHNSDTNREFGGNGPNGPHGSRFSHILERRYEYSQVSPGLWPSGGPGTTITNLFPSPTLDPASNGPYSLCAKCHDLDRLMTSSSFPGHRSHIALGASCSVCHSAHGVPSGTIGVTGTGLVSFDMNVVGRNGGSVSYLGGSTCSLVCHKVQHNANGSIVQLTR